ncbi:hypothetical protein [Lewinella sp. W8]|uniref:hypothetical protein n=1 Tax=Lewinella sp. W8 TaxID=2528208 RepID=UPI0010689F6B|nr:hypothetical protein [Lewinella sp. W8]MTB51159.1 hypothetical protein [Lewinella sp. W8]
MPRLLLLILMISGTCALAPNTNNGVLRAQKILDLDRAEPTFYFDQGGVAISKQKFNRLFRSNRQEYTYGDSATVRRLVARVTEGRLEGRSAFLRSLAEGIGRPVRDDQPTVIVFYPGFDECNSTGTSDRYLIKQWHDEMEEKLLEIADVKPLYLYKDNYGLRKYYNIINWLEDPDQLVEKRFFRYHYPCRSFVVIGVDGRYQSYFGGFSQDRIVEAARAVLD